MTSTTLSESLGLHPDSEYFLILHDHIRGLNYVRSSEQVCREGLFMRLHAYEYYVFNDVYEVRDDEEHTWRQLYEWLNGDGTPNIQEALEEIRYGFILHPYRGCFDGNKLRWLHNAIGVKIYEETWNELRNGTWTDFENLSNAFRGEFGYPAASGKELFNLYISGMSNMLKDPINSGTPDMKQYKKSARKVSEIIHTKPILWNIELIAGQERLLTDELAPDRPNIHEQCHLNKSLVMDLKDTDLYDISPNEQAELIQWLYYHLDDMKEWTDETLEDDLDSLLMQGDTMRLLKTNFYDHVTWFNKEAAETLVDLIRISGYYMNVFDPATSASEQIEDTMRVDKAADLLEERIAKADYHFDRLLTVKEEPEEEAEEDEEASESDQKL